MYRLAKAAARVLALLLIGTAPGLAQGADRPTLVVVVTVDQLRPDYLERWGHQLEGGLARLAEHGAFFTNAFHDHAITETAPGHASVLSGRFPRSTGIMTNTLGVGDPQSPVIGGGGDGASPFRFRGGTLIDWLRTEDVRSRALSVSRKDRGAILPLGRAHQEAYWYATGTGWMTTSDFYADTLPTWVRRFNERRIPQSYAGRIWSRLLPPEAYPEADTVAAENRRSPGANVFPHRLPEDSTITAAFTVTPFMDRLTLDLALEGLRELGLGAGPHTDLLAVGLSATDAVGHAFGPDSEELHDQVLRLDRMLGEFMDSLYATRDSADVVLALTADHGVAPFPEVHDPGNTALYVDVEPAGRSIADRLAAAGVEPEAFEFDDGQLFVDREAVAAAGLDVEALVEEYAAAVRALPGVMRVDRPRDLARADTVADPIARRWLHSLPPDMPVELVVTLEPYHTWPRDYAMHGTPHDYDAHVPLILYGPAFRTGRYDEVVRTVDLAPTLARVLGVTPTEPLDGVVLEAALR